MPSHNKSVSVTAASGLRQCDLIVIFDKQSNGRRMVIPNAAFDSDDQDDEDDDDDVVICCRCCR